MSQCHHAYDTTPLREYISLYASVTLTVPELSRVSVQTPTPLCQSIPVHQCNTCIATVPGLSRVSTPLCQSIPGTVSVTLVILWQRGFGVCTEYMQILMIYSYNTSRNNFPCTLDMQLFMLFFFCPNFASFVAWNVKQCAAVIYHGKVTQLNQGCLMMYLLYMY